MQAAKERLTLGRPALDRSRPSTLTNTAQLQHAEVSRRTHFIWSRACTKLPSSSTCANQPSSSDKKG